MGSKIITFNPLTDKNDLMNLHYKSFIYLFYLMAYPLGNYQRKNTDSLTNSTGIEKKCLKGVMIKGYNLVGLNCIEGGRLWACF